LQEVIQDVLSFLGVVANPNDLDDLFFVQIFEPSAGKHIVVGLFDEQQASFLEPLAVELVRVLEYLAD
jgi:hypothetical protein